jgi:hypothetical protein
MATDVAADRPVSDPSEGPGRPDEKSSARLRTALGWVAGAGVVVAIAWLIMTLVSAAALYPLMAPNSWQGEINPAGFAKIGLVVNDTGTGSADNCRAVLKVGSAAPISSAPQSVSPGRSRILTVELHATSALGSAPAYAWLQCSNYTSPRQLATLPLGLSLRTSQPVVKAGASATTVSFMVTSPGRDDGRQCQAWVLMSSGLKIAAGNQPVVPAHSGLAAGGAALGTGRGAEFTVSYQTGTGRPRKVWATCSALGASSWTVISTQTRVPGS